MNNLKEIDIREIDGFLIGNAENEKTATGCTAILCPSGAFAGVRSGRGAGIAGSSERFLSNSFQKNERFPRQ